MSKSRHPDGWLSLFAAPGLDPTARLKAAMREALRGSPLSREQVVDEMNRLAQVEGMPGTGRSTSVATLALLEKWVSSSPNVLPLRLLPIFCRVTASLLPIQALAGAAGGAVVCGEDLALLEWARAERERKQAGRKARRLAQEAGVE